MGSIATMRGDAGQTSLAGGIRVSKSSLRVDVCGGTDALTAALRLARLCASPRPTACPCFSCCS